MQAQQHAIHKSTVPEQPRPFAPVNMIASQTSEPVKKRCATPAGIHEEYEAWITKQMQKDNAFANVKKTNTVYTIPVVFHIIHSGQPVGTGFNISQAQVNSQVTILNQDYSKTNTNFSAWVTQPAFITAAADVQIQFCLATVKPDGSTLAEPGIDRVNAVARGWKAPPYQSPSGGSNLVEDTIKPDTSWDPTKYLNIWVVAFSDGTLGYAQFPTVPSASTPTIGDMAGQGGAANTDGVAFDYRAVGNTGAAAAPYNLGRTASHEIGHFFGLYHPNGDVSCGNDYCADTPTVDQLSGACPDTAGKVVASGCSASPSPPGRMYQDYMDYSDDACLAMFTNDQKSRMMACIQYCVRRTSLTTSNACATVNSVAENSNHLRAVSVYPNPSSGEVTVGVEADNISDFTISILNTLGQVVYETRKEYTDGSKTSISLPGQPQGLYFVRVASVKGITTLRLVLQ